MEPRSVSVGILAAAISLASAACEGTIGDRPKTDAPPGGPLAEMTLEGPVLPLLTTKQYRAALVALFGEDLPATPVQPDTNPFLFYSIGATGSPISELGVEQLEQAADAVTHAVFDDSARRSALVGCEPRAPGDGCASDFIETFGRRAFRRALSADEQAKWVGVSVQLADGDAWLGLRMAVAGMLQASSFVYRVELGVPDEADPSRVRYTGWEMASRLSFLLWNGPPDDELLDAAENGTLDGPEGIELHAWRMLDDERAREAVQDFFSQYLDLGRLDTLTRDAQMYPLFTATMAESMRSEVELLVDDLVNRRDTDVRGLFSTRRTFVNSDLAQLYGVEAEGASAVAFVPVELPEGGNRAGMLTLGAFLAMNAHETSTSPTLRGKYVRERVLCDSVPPPPPDVNTEIKTDPEEPKTLRETLEQHRDNPACASCHQFIDPPGFLFENFDAIGSWRTKDNGYPIDSTGDLDGVPLANARDLADLLATHERVGKCMVKQLYRHAHGRLDEKGEKVALDQIHGRFEKSGFRFRELLVALVTHESFRFAAEVEKEDGQ